MSRVRDALIVFLGCLLATFFFALIALNGFDAHRDIVVAMFFMAACLIWREIAIGDRYLFSDFSRSTRKWQRKILFVFGESSGDQDVEAEEVNDLADLFGSRVYVKSLAFFGALFAAYIYLHNRHDLGVPDGMVFFVIAALMLTVASHANHLLLALFTSLPMVLLGIWRAPPHTPGFVLFVIAFVFALMSFRRLEIAAASPSELRRSMRPLILSSLQTAALVLALLFVFDRVLPRNGPVTTPPPLSSRIPYSGEAIGKLASVLNPRGGGGYRAGGGSGGGSPSGGSKDQSSVGGGGAAATRPWTGSSSSGSKDQSSAGGGGAAATRPGTGSPSGGSKDQSSAGGGGEAAARPGTGSPSGGSKDQSSAGGGGEAAARPGTGSPSGGSKDQSSAGGGGEAATRPGTGSPSSEGPPATVNPANPEANGTNATNETDGQPSEATQQQSSEPPDAKTKDLEKKLTNWFDHLGTVAEFAAAVVALILLFNFLSRVTKKVKVMEAKMIQLSNEDRQSLRKTLQALRERQLTPSDEILQTYHALLQIFEAVHLARAPEMPVSVFTDTIRAMLPYLGPHLHEATSCFEATLYGEQEVPAQRVQAFRGSVQKIVRYFNL